MKLKFKALDQILNKQLGVWSWQNRVHKPSKKKEKKFFPCITVSREAGSGGRLVARLVAKKLKLKYYDKKIVTLIVEKTKKRKDLISSLDEKRLGVLEETLGTFFSGRKISAPTYFRNLVKVIMALGQKESCVILGRGGNFVLPPEYVLRVSIIAPLKTRIKSTIKYEKKSKRKAEEIIRETDLNRKKFIKKYFLKDISNSDYYDLVINTRNFSLEEVRDIIIAAYKKKFLKKMILVK